MLPDEIEPLPRADKRIAQLVIDASANGCQSLQDAGFAGVVRADQYVHRRQVDCHVPQGFVVTYPKARDHCFGLATCCLSRHIR
jgi:hypothetical protein